MIYLQGEGWYAYDKFRRPRCDEMIDIVIPPLSGFLARLQQARVIVSARNMFKNLATGETRPMKKLLLDIEIDISSATRCVGVIFVLRPFYRRTRPMGENPYILHLQNATVGLGLILYGTLPPSTTPRSNRIYAYLITLCLARRIRANQQKQRRTGDWR